MSTGDPWDEPELESEPLDAYAPELDEPAGPTVEFVECWRCGKPVEEGAACARCGARPKWSSIASGGPGPRAVRSVGETAAVRLLAAYGLLLITSVVYGWFIRFGLDARAFAAPDAAESQVYRMMALEAFDAVLILAAVAWVPVPEAVGKVSTRRAIASWLASPLLLAVALGANFGYHQLILRAAGLPDVQDELVQALGIGPLLILSICVLPAIFEEIFFRHLALGRLRGVTGVHGAVFVSSIMFGVLHIFAPLSIPILMVVGVVLGYARVLSGGLLLPILLHFAHNLIVILVHAS